MDFFINKIQNSTNGEGLSNDKLSFKGVKSKGTVTEISDEIFKIASTAIAATGLATLGINGNRYLKRKSVEDAETVQKHEELVTQAELARRLGVDSHSIEWHLREHLVTNEDGLIDLNNRINKRFLETYNKGTRFVETLYPPEKYSKLQKILTKYLPIEYCLQHGLLTADDGGYIDTLAEQNKDFIEKIRNKELSYKDYFMSCEAYAEYLKIGRISVQRSIERGDIVLNEQKRIDINNEANKAFEVKVRHACQRAKEKGLKRTASFSRVQGDNINLLTRAEFAKEAGFKTVGGLNHHINNGRVVLNEDGFIDISIEPNKSFLEAKRNGTYISQPDVYRRLKKEKTVNPNIVSQTKFSEMIGISPATLRYHVSEGHVVLNENGKIDITNEKNKYFLENHKKGVALHPTQTKKKSVPKEKEIEIKNPNQFNVVDLRYITGLSATALHFHVSKNRLVKENDKIDIKNPVNKRFIDSYEEKQIENLNKMTASDLRILENALENRYKSLLARTLYVRAREAKNKSEEEYNAYIEELTFSLFRVEILSERELKYLKKTIKNIIESRLNDKEKPEDFSDIKDFKLSGVIELEYELGIIDKLIENENALATRKIEINSFLNKNISPKMLKFKFDISKFIKSEEYVKKLKEILAKLRAKEEAAKIEFEKMTVEELQAKLFEYHQADALKNNTKLLRATEFLFGFEIKSDEDKELLVSFIKALYDFIKNPAEDKEFPAEILTKVHHVEENLLNEAERKKAKLDWVNGKLTESINFLYDKGLVFAADVVFNNIPKNADNEQEIRNGIYVMKLIDKLKEKPELSEEDKKKLSKEEQEAKIEKLEKQRDIEIENALIGYGAATSDSKYLKDALDYSRTKYGVNKYRYIGEYLRHISNLENCDSSNYPNFCEDVFLDLTVADKRQAVDILVKLQEWNTFTDAEKKSFTEMLNRFSKKNPTEEAILRNYLEKYYVDFDTTIIAVGVKDNSLRIPAVLTKKAKKQMVKEIAEKELVDYFEEFEYAMTRIIPPKGHSGIKVYQSNKGTTSRTHEVTVSYPARLYCHRGGFYIFDEFVYDSHKGANS